MHYRLYVFAVTAVLTSTHALPVPTPSTQSPGNAVTPEHTGASPTPKYESLNVHGQCFRGVVPTGPGGSGLAGIGAGQSSSMGPVPSRPLSIANSDPEDKIDTTGLACPDNLVPGYPPEISWVTHHPNLSLTLPGHENPDRFSLNTPRNAQTTPPSEKYTMTDAFQPGALGKKEKQNKTPS